MQVTTQVPARAGRGCAHSVTDLLVAPPGPDGGSLLLRHASAAVPAARRVLVEELRRDAVAADVVADVAVVASELLGNAVRHAAPLGSGDVLLRWCVDHGGGGPLVEREPSRIATSGRGLGIIDALSSSWGERTDRAGRRTVWAAVPSGSPLRAAS